MPITPSVELGDLIRRAQAGSNEAANIVFDRCRGPLLAVIRRTLSQPLRRFFDSQDFLQDSLMQIFQMKFTDELLGSPQDLWRYLQTIAENKVCDARRKFLVAKRSNISHDVQANDQQEMGSNDLTQEDALLLQELVEGRVCDFLENLPLVYKRVAQLSIQGKTVGAIAYALGSRPKTVYLVLDLLINKLCT